MLTHSLKTEYAESPSSYGPLGVPQSAASGRVGLCMDFTDPQLAVLTVTGDLDVVTTPRLAELLWPRLQTMLKTLVLDLHAVSFLGVSALELLACAHTYAIHRGITLCVINTTPAVKRALAAGGLAEALPCFASLSAARTALAPGLEAQAIPARSAPCQGPTHGMATPLHVRG